MVVMPAGFAGLEVKNIKLYDVIFGEPGKDSSPSVTDGVKVAGWMQDFYLHGLQYREAPRDVKMRKSANGQV